MGFRSDHEALLHKIRALESEIDELKSSKGEGLREQLDALRAEVAELHSEAERDENALQRTLARIDAIRARAFDANAKEPSTIRKEGSRQSEPSPPIEAAERRLRAPAAFATVLGMALFCVVGLAVIQHDSCETTEQGSAPATPATPTSADPLLDEIMGAVATRSLAEVPGAPHRVQPLAMVEDAKAVSAIGGEAQLVSITATYVGHEGYVDLDAPSYQGTIHYVFARPLSAVQEPANVPIGAPRVTSPNARTSTVILDREGLQGPPRYVADGLEGHVRFIHAPRCTFAGAWALAVTRGAPQNAVARIDYRARENDGEATWSFSIRDTDVDLQFSDDECAAAAENARAEQP